MMLKQPCVYILASQRNGTLYIGVTSDVVQRVGQHRLGTFDGFTKRYNVHLLVHAEFFSFDGGGYSAREATEGLAKGLEVAVD